MFIEPDPQGNEIIVQPAQVRIGPVPGNGRIAVDDLGIVPFSCPVVRFHRYVFFIGTDAIGKAVLDQTSRY